MSEPAPQTPRQTILLARAKIATRKTKLAFLRPRVDFRLILPAAQERIPCPDFLPPTPLALALDHLSEIGGIGPDSSWDSFELPVSAQLTATERR